jgi:6-phosphogluconolactonase
MNFKEYADREMLAMAVADRIAGELQNALLGNDFATIALPGGTTPAPIFDMLNDIDLDWHKVRVLLTDERWVPESDDQSNAALLRRHLLIGRAADAQFIPYFQPDLTPQEGCAAMAETLKDVLPLSIALLGMGADMHTASLFPGAEGLDAALASDAPALCPVTPDNQPTARVTLSAPVLDDAMTKHLVIFGDAKRAAVERAASLSRQEAPITAVWEGATIHWAA